MLGLKKGTVKLSSHHEEWKTIFLQVRAELLEIFDGNEVDIQHVGSTAITGIKAKPILDIAIGVKDKSIIPELKSKLEELDYEYRGDKGKAGGKLFVKNSAPKIRTQHLHVVEINDYQWENYLAFRDFLNAHPAIAKNYEQLKIELMEKYPEDRALYTASKQRFIEKILKEYLKTAGRKT